MGNRGSGKWPMVNGKYAMASDERWVSEGGFRKKNSIGEILIRYVLHIPLLTICMDALYAGLHRSKTVKISSPSMVHRVIRVYIITEWAFCKDTEKLNLFQKLYSSCNSVMIRGINITYLRLRNTADVPFKLISNFASAQTCFCNNLHFRLSFVLNYMT